MAYKKMQNKKELEYMEKDYKKLARANWEKIAKPLDSLGELEELVVKLCYIKQCDHFQTPLKKAVVSMCADHGVVAEGVTQCDSSVTLVVTKNFANGCSSVNYMAEIAGADVFAVDMGMNNDYHDIVFRQLEADADKKLEHKQLKTGVINNRKIANGTKNLLKESAMTLQECEAAIQIGKDIVLDLKSQGYEILATGEMGIGNTTPTAILTALFLNLDAEKVTGRGAGLSDEGLSRKLQVVSESIARVKELERTKQKATGDDTYSLSAKEILAEVGGLEIAGMVGMFLGGVEHHMPIVIDGCISSVAALVAAKIDERVKDYAIASHVSAEPTGKLIMDELGLSAIVHGNMRLGEGSGAVTLFPLIDMVCNVYHKMGSFDDLRIDQYERYV